jgi:peptide/nickel transport system substrate-binding protein
MIAKILTMLLGLTLVLAVACGTTAEPTAVPDPTATQAAVTVPVTEPTAAPAESDTPQPTVAPVESDTPLPTATPQMVAPPTDVEVNPGKVTWLTGDFGNERFDSTFAVAGSGKDYAGLIHAYLIDTDAAEGSRVFAPGIATKWDMSGDGLTWTLTIRAGVKFHDGSDLTAEDVLWTLQHGMGPQAKDYAASTTSVALSNIIDRIEQTAPDQVSVTTNVPVVDFPLGISEAAPNFLGGVLPKRATLHNVEEEAAYDRNPIGAGIMLLVEHVQSDSVSFERFDDYYHQPKNGFPTDKRVNFSVFNMRLVPEEATRAAALRAGEADIAPLSLGAKQQVEAGGGRLVFGQEGSYFYIQQLGCWEPQYPCSDKRVRQALQYSIDKELIQDQLYGGPEVMQVKGWSRIVPSTLGYSPDLDPYPFDPDKARQLLAEAGYPGGEGFGNLVVNTHVSNSVPLLPESAQLVASMWEKELGLDVEVEIGNKAAQDVAAFTDEMHGEIWWRDGSLSLDGSRIVRKGKSWGGDAGSETVHYDPELLALAAKTDATLDPVEREQALNTAYRRFRDEAYWISLGYVNIPWGVGPRIATWEPYPLANYPTGLHTITLK